MRSKKSLIVLILILSSFAIVQRASAACPPSQDSNLVTWTDDLVDCLPGAGTDDFLEPDATDITNFKAAVAALLAEDWTGADTLADVVGYEVFAYNDAGNGNETIYALHPESGNTDSRGYFFVRPQAQVKRNLVLEAPHPANDEDTALLAARIFREVGARAFFFAGTDRCANAATTSCVGTTGVCSGGTGPHRISDMAHHEKSFFQAFHEVASQEADTISIQLHGFGSGLPGYAFSISDGSVVTRPLSYLTNAVAAEFESRMLAAQPLVDFPGNSCNRAGNLEELCGTESVQGRFTNGTDNLCLVNEVFSLEANGRFIHLELSRDLRDAEQGGEDDNFDSQLVIDALNAAFPERGAKVADFVWADLNDDGIQDAGEPGLEKVELRLHPAGQSAVTTESARDGGYAFRGLTAGDYEAEVVAPTGYALADQGSGSDLEVDSDFDGTGFTENLNMAVNERRLDIDAGLFPLATNGQISGRVWNDTDGDGRKEAGEANLSDVTILLFSEAGTQLNSAVAAAGTFSFSNLLPGKYYLRFDAGTRGLAEPAAGVDTDANPQTGKTALITLAPGTMTVSNVDAGVIVKCFQKTFIALGGSWKTLSPSSASGVANWNLPGFSDVAWSTQTAPLGYNAAGMTAVTVPAFPSHTVYFRRTFQVTDPAVFQYLSLRVLRDDGVVVYVNGTEVFRNNMPQNPIDAGTPALDSASGEVFAQIPASVLVTGTNLVAVELHDRRKEEDDNPDGRFNLELTGNICDTCRVATTTISSTVATFLSQGSPTANSGSDTEVEFDGSSGVQTRGLIKWDLSSPALDSLDILAVEFEMNVTNTTNDTFPLYQVRRDWSETQATWNLAKTGTSWGTAGAGNTTSDYVATSLGSLPKTGATGIFSIPLNQSGIDVVKGWIAGTISNFGLVSVAPGSGGGIDISSDDAGANLAPKLRLIHTVATCTP